MYKIQQRALSIFLETQPDGKWRGLTRDTLDEAGAGYNAKYKSITLRYDEYTFFWREVNGKGKGVNKGGKRRLYEPLPLKVGRGKVNFLMEGEIDALSVKQVLSSDRNTFGVAATGSIGVVHMTIAELDKRFGTCAEKPRFIWLADNDSPKEDGSRPGVDGAKKMVAALNAAGYATTLVFFAGLDEPKVDANAYLRKHGDDKLARFLLGLLNDKGSELDSLEAEIKQAAKEKREAEALEHGINVCSLTKYLSGDFDKELDRVSAYAGRATGFDTLDDKQLFLPGVYVLGGSPGAGKTTFAWQLLNQLATGDDCRGRSAEYCVYCSYEMSRLELASKSIAREMRRRHFASKEEDPYLSSAKKRIQDGSGKAQGVRA